MLLITPDTPETEFPPADSATTEGLVAVGGKLTTKRILSAYRQGIFPWYSDEQPVLWWSPEPRAILYPDAIKISRSLKKAMRREHFQVTADTAFTDVITCCAAPRSDSPSAGTWITNDMMDAYCQLHELGHAHSIEVWLGEKLIGGLYGLCLGSMFCGESMFSRHSNASKVALVSLARSAEQLHIDFIDCQLPTAHLASLGAISITRRRYLGMLEEALHYQRKAGHWSLEG
jgi:leucyl/phenylalanyl-tRNA--protein transferase